MSEWNPILMCYVNRISYDAARKQGTIQMPEGGCTDMRGAIRLFKGIDPEVRSIGTYAGENPDTAYFLLDDGWEAFLPEEVEP